MAFYVIEKSPKVDGSTEVYMLASYYDDQKDKAIEAAEFHERRLAHIGLKEFGYVTVVETTAGALVWEPKKGRG